MIKLSVCLALALAACAQADATTPPAAAPPAKPGTATPGSELRTVPAFHAVEVSSVIDADISIGPSRVELTGDPDALAKVETKVKNGTLVLDLDGSFDKSPHIRAIISLPELTAVSLSGVGKVRAANLAAKALDVSVSGVGTIELTGTTEALHVSLSGSGKLLAKDLTVASTTVDVSGVGNATVTTTHDLTAAISGVGNVIVYGHPPVVNKAVSGLGHVKLK